MKTFSAIVLVDEDPISRFIARRVLARLRLTDHLFIAQSGDQALRVLQHLPAGQVATSLLLVQVSVVTSSTMAFLRARQRFGLAPQAEVIVSAYPMPAWQLRHLEVKHLLLWPLTEEKLTYLLRE
ncbi:hypothetical protein [Hymenobacter sp. GOD-10R]|uniref:hypothetical protein n=1 Tax=Hymenobacter sp. GOD-10R TaxID=3093922 RepID=UPI002D78D2DA|nr:hypothetical protein [Hymenobacter sp. GOD-10R]WRQ31651.1 hypothetical protein SD425_27855 [Hymenobacter sp. GOD-10R]